MTRLLRVFLAGTALAFAAPKVPAALAEVPSVFTQLLDRSALEWRGVVVNVEQVSSYYSKPDARPLFVSGQGLSAQGEALLAAISNAEGDGLVGSDYLPRALREVKGVQSAQDAALWEMALANSFLNFARDLHSGRTTPSVTNPNIVIARKSVDADTWLSVVSKSGIDKTVAQLRPGHPQYYQLRQMLAGYRALAQRGGWPSVGDGVVLKPGMNDPRLGELRANLTARGYSGILGGAQPQLYDQGLVQVIQHFQKRHGLDADGVIGPATLRALNVPAEDRVKQIIVNMERWRWLPAELGSRHVFVNQAGFEMFFINGNKVIDQRRVIVGKPYHQTPIFSDVIRYAEFNPTWTVPPSIAKSEMLPKLQSNPAYLEGGDYKIYAGWGPGSQEISPYMVDWSAVSPSSMNYRIVQQPGDKNALGRVKFMFPNKFNIYLHDTPSRQLFAKTGRAFSHGCIRVNDPLDFAALLFGTDQNMTRAQVDQIVGTSETKRVSLKTPVPVHLTYFTTWVDENGIPSFFEDVYERDALVAKLLFGNV